MSQVYPTTTSAIVAGAATGTSNTLNGLITGIRIQVLTSAFASSSNTADVTITDTNMGRTILAKTGLTGLNNFYQPQFPVHTSAGVETGVYTPINLITNTLTVTVANGTATDYVRVFVELL